MSFAQTPYNTVPFEKYLLLLKKKNAIQNEIDAIQKEKGAIRNGIGAIRYENFILKHNVVRI